MARRLSVLTMLLATAFIEVGCSRGSDTACRAKTAVAADLQEACSTKHDAKACQAARVFGATPSTERAEAKAPRLLGAVGGGGVLFSTKTEPTPTLSQLFPAR
jgi:hypothetical protein